MVFWSWYRRDVRYESRYAKLFVRRARCRACRVTHALLPGFVLQRRLDASEAIGHAICEVIEASSGVRPTAASLGIPDTTARGWLRRFREQAARIGAAFSALAVELGGEVVRPLGDAARLALSAMRAAFTRAAELPGWSFVGLWQFCSAVSGGALLATNTDSPYLVIGRRRFMPPVPPTNDKDGEDGP